MQSTLLTNIISIMLNSVSAMIKYYKQIKEFNIHIHFLHMWITI